MSIKMSCSWCEKDFEITPSRFEKNNLNYFCCRECYRNFVDSNKVLNQTCPICNKKFHTKPYRQKKTKGSICCSKKCDAERRSREFLGENNHQYGLKGDLNSSHISDVRISSYGYMLVRNTTHPFRMFDDWIFLHRCVYEEWLKNNDPSSPFLIEIEGLEDKFLDPDVVVHHKNENKLDNTIKNLELMYRSQHTHLHMEERKYERDEFNNLKVVSGKYKNTSKENRQLFKKNSQDAGLDIKSNEDAVIKSQCSAIISTGLFLEIPDNHVGLIWSRSGLSVKNKVEVGAGCIDASYRGEIKVHLYNYSSDDFEIKKGDRIAQLLTVPINLSCYTEVDELSETKRGDSGFGSTGIK